MNLTIPSTPLLPISQMLDENDSHLQLQGGSNSGNVIPVYTAIDLASGRNPDSSHLIHDISLDTVTDLC